MLFYPFLFPFSLWYDIMSRRRMTLHDESYYPSISHQIHADFVPASISHNNIKHLLNTQSYIMSRETLFHLFWYLSQVIFIPNYKNKSEYKDIKINFAKFHIGIVSSSSFYKLTNFSFKLLANLKIDAESSVIKSLLSDHSQIIIAKKIAASIYLFRAWPQILEFQLCICIWSFWESPCPISSFLTCKINMDIIRNGYKRSVFTLHSKSVILDFLFALNHKNLATLFPYP